MEAAWWWFMGGALRRTSIRWVQSSRGLILVHSEVSAHKQSYQCGSAFWGSNMIASPQISPERAESGDSRPNEWLFHNNLSPRHHWLCTLLWHCLFDNVTNKERNIPFPLCPFNRKIKTMQADTGRRHTCAVSHAILVSPPSACEENKRKLCKAVSSHRGYFAKANWTLWRLLRRDVMQIPPM